MTKEHLALTISLTAHLALMSIIALSASWERDQPVSLGSEELDIEVLAPRLAPPIRATGHQGQASDPARGTVDKDRTEGAPSEAGARENHQDPPVTEKSLRSARAEVQPPKETSTPRAKIRGTRAAKSDVKSGGLSSPTPKGDATLGYMSRELPRTASLAILTSMGDELNQRKERHRRAIQEQRARQAAVERELARLKAFQGKALRSGHRSRAISAGGVGVSGAGAGVSGDRAGAEVGAGKYRGAGKRRGAEAVEPRYGLKFYLSGRRVENGKVVRPPEPIHIPPIRCKISSPTATPATVRLLVDMKGKVSVAYLKHSSSSKKFDSCALKHTKAIRFKPGEDVKGAPLDVWIHLRVEPSLVTAQL